MQRRFLITFSIVTLITVFFSVIVTQKREERRALEADQWVLAEQVSSLREENDRLTRENKALVNDPIQVEREARDNYGYTKEGEVTYKKYKFNISEPDNGVAETPVESGVVEEFLFEGPFPWQVPLGLIVIASLFLFFSYKYER